MPTTVPAILIDVSRCEGCGNCQRCCDAANDLPCDTWRRSSTPRPTRSSKIASRSGRERPVRQAGVHALPAPRLRRRPARWLRSTRTRTASWSPTPPSASAAATASTPARSACPSSSGTITLGVMRKCTGCEQRIAPRGRRRHARPAAPRVRSRRDRAASCCRRRTPVSKPPLISTLARVYGEFEAGGTSRLYISDVPFEELGFPAVDSAPVPHYCRADRHAHADHCAERGSSQHRDLRRPAAPRASGREHDTIEIEEK